MCSRDSFDEVFRKICAKKEWFESESKLSNKEVSNCQFDTSSMSISDLANYENESKILFVEPEGKVNEDNFERPFVFEQAKRGVRYNCTICRESKGFLRHFNPSFTLYMEEGDEKKFLLSGKKNTLSNRSQFVIYADLDFEREVAKLSSNFLGTCFTLMTRDEELGAVVYSRKFKRPREFHFVVPVSRMLLSRTAAVLESFKKKEFKDLICYQNKAPKWNQVTKSYVLNLDGKVKIPSTRNFKIVDRSENELVLLFGKCSKDRYVLEYSHPLCAVQAFGVALTTFSTF